MMLHIIGTILGIYIAFIICFKDWNIMRGIETWIEKIVKEAFDEAKKSMNGQMTERDVKLIAHDIVSKSFKIGN